MIELSPHLKENLPKEATFDYLLNLSGTVHRKVANRTTVAFSIGDRSYFIKVHRSCGWGEILKQLFQFRRPVVSAKTEWEAIAFLHGVNIPTMTVVGKGCRGRIPAQRDSFVITEALEGMMSLEDLVNEWRGIPIERRVALKQHLIEQVAVVARIMHGNGMNHRDFYLCHFLVKRSLLEAWRPGGDPLKLYLIDLHRAQVRDRAPSRWLVKDLGGLLFSALDCGLTEGDLVRFLSIYRQAPWRQSLIEEKRFWRQVLCRAIRLYRSFHGSEAPLPGIFRP